MKTNYQSAIERINRCETIEQTINLERSFKRVWDAGCLTIEEFKRIDWAMVKHQIKLTERKFQPLENRTDTIEEAIAIEDQTQH